MAIIALHSAATGMTALSTQLDVISNNIANANNNGFKASRATFEDLLYQYQQLPGAKNELGDIQPIGVAVGYGTRVNGTQLDMSQGSMIQTGRQYDVCIQGTGFFRVKVMQTQGDGFGYTRSGNFFVNTDGKLVCNSQDGYLLDPPITVPQDSTGITISQDGRVFSTNAGSTNSQEIGQIQIANFRNPQGLIQMGGNFFQRSDASGPEILQNPGLNGTGVLQQAALETSNVDPVTELVNMIKTQRTFELNSQSIQAADQMLQQVNNLRR
ncbi:MAG: flagellar basal-body rod protein FlgG [Phycisphaerales bacterium]|nr:flagellar basal-body rod protein FlgG [Phycisphaerales bacterium]